MELLHSLGIDWRLLIAQLVNFVILLAVLYKFLYRPVLKLLHERSTRIEQSLKNADAVEQKLQQATESYDAKIVEARSKAQEILTQVQKEAEEQRAVLTQKAQAESQKIIDSGRKQLASDKDKIIKEAEEELVGLVAEATEHVLGSIVTPEMDKKLIEDAVRKVRIGRA